MTTTLHSQVERRLAEFEVRYTRGRRGVVAVLAEADGPRSASELTADLDVPLSSVYRTLSVLEDADIVAPHLATKGIARYELAEWLSGHHHHLVCVECGTVEDIDVPEEYESQLRASVEMIAGRSGFTPSNHALEIAGQCRRCA